MVSEQRITVLDDLTSSDEDDDDDDDGNGRGEKKGRKTSDGEMSPSEATFLNTMGS